MFASLTDPALAASLQNGGVIVVPTDTTYGIIARASNKAAVERIYHVRGRAPQKPLIVLVAGMWQIADKSLWTAQHRALAQKYWPGALSLVAPTTIIPEYLHRGTSTLAYRVPAHLELQKLLERTGPLVAPSANPEGLPTAATLTQTRGYFGDNVDGYVDGGRLDGDKPSTLVTVVDGRITVLRQGVLNIPETAA